MILFEIKIKRSQHAAAPARKIIVHKKADASASAFVFQAQSTALVDDVLAAAFATADDVTISRRTLVDNLQ